MANTNKYHTILVAFGGDASLTLEGVAKETIKPGQLVVVSSDGKLIANPTANPNTDPPRGKLIATEQKFIGKGVNSDWNDTTANYLAGDLVEYYALRAGDRVITWLAPGETVSVGETVSYDGAEAAFPGTITAHGPLITTGRFKFGYALEAVNNSAGVVPVKLMVAII